MSKIGRLFGRLFGREAGKEDRPRPRAKYDAAQDGPRNDRHWSGADNLSSRAANSPTVRDKLRKRSRYEYENNCYYKGLVEKIAGAIVGSKLPRLQLTIPGAPREVASKIEASFGRWAEAVGLFDKLRVANETQIRDGECFAILATNPKINHAVKLSLRLYEADQVSTPWLDTFDPLAVDGLRVDKYGNIIEFHFLKFHPGDTVWNPNWDAEIVDPKYVLHWMRDNRPGQWRAIPELTPGLPLLAQLRRYCLATLGSAEIAAKIAGILHTNASAANQNPVRIEAMDEIDMPDQGLFTLPFGWDIEQIDAKQPVTQFGEFKDENLGELGCAVQAPRNQVTGSSAKYNFSAAQLDKLIFQESIKSKRNRERMRTLNRIVPAWLDEARLVKGEIPNGLPDVNQWSFDWMYSGFSDIDENKAATARTERLKSRTTTFAHEEALQGRDWEETLAQQKREIEAFAAAGVTDPYTAASGSVPIAPGKPQPLADSGDAADEEAPADA